MIPEAWRCGSCGYEQDSDRGTCPQCGDDQWEEQLRDEDPAGDHLRPGS